MVIDTFWEEFHVFDINGIVDNILYLNMLKYSDKLEKIPRLEILFLTVLELHTLKSVPVGHIKGQENSLNPL